MLSKLVDTRLLLALVVVVVTALAVACGGNEEEAAAPTAAAAAPAAPAAAAEKGFSYGGHLRVATILGYPPKFDLTQTSTYIALLHYVRMYNGLLQFSPRDGVEIWPSLATDWSVSSDGLEYTFNIDPRVTQWQDGHPFDVNDIVWAYNRWVNPPEGIIQPRRGGLNFDKIEKVDATTVKIILSGPSAVLVPETANAWHAILPKHILEANDNTLPSADLLIGTGPYLWDETETGVSTSSVRWPEYTRTDPDGNQYPYLDRVTTVTFAEPETLGAALRTKRLDMYKQTSLFNSISQKIARDNPGKFTVDLSPMTDIGSFQLNNQAPPFDDINARKAVLYGFNKKRLIDDQVDVEPINPATWYANLVFAPDEIAQIMPGLDPSKREEEKKLANEFAKAAGLTKFEVLAVPIRVHQAEMLAQDMKECCGVDVTIRQVDWTSMVAACEGRKMEASTGGTAPSYAGVLSIIGLMWAPGGGRNCGWDATMPPQWLDLWNQVKVMPRSVEREKILRQMHEIMLNDWVPSVPYLGATSFKGWWNYVHNISNVAQDLFSDNVFEDVWLDDDAPEK